MWASMFLSCAIALLMLLIWWSFAFALHLLSFLVLCFIFIYCKVIASLSHLFIIHWCMSCFVLLCSVFPPLPASSLGCLYLGPFCVFSCACPSPSRSKHRGAHSDSSGGETAEDQSSAQTGGGPRYASGIDRMGLCGFCWLEKVEIGLFCRCRERKQVGGACE